METLFQLLTGLFQEALGGSKGESITSFGGWEYYQRILFACVWQSVPESLVLELEVLGFFFFFYFVKMILG